MAKLPSVSDLGPAPAVDGSRPVAGYDVSPIARGGQAAAQAEQALGKGVGDLAGGMGELGIDQQRYEYATAHAGFLTDHINLESSLAHDQDYTTLPDRYDQQAKAIQAKWAGTIGNPAMRERFDATTGETLAQGNAKVKQQAFKLSGDNQIGYVQQQGDNLINATLKDPTNDTLVDQSAQAYGGMVDGLIAKGYVTPETGLRMKQNHAVQFAIAHGVARSEIDPVGTLNELRAAPGSPEQIDNRIIQIESNGNPLARSKTSSASGLGQFTDGTWLDLIKQQHPDLAQGRSDAELLALRADPTLSREMVAANRVRNTAVLQKQGIDPTAGNIYLAHFLGAGDAAKVLQVDPSTPVADILDPKVIAANPTILAGKTAGAVAQWAEGRMGGVGPGGGHLYDILPPDKRAMLEQHAYQAATAQTITTGAQFRNSVADDVAEANRTGAVTNPKGAEQFIATYGAAQGPLAYQNYKADVQAGADRIKLAGLSIDDTNKLIATYAPQPGPGYAAAAERQNSLIQRALEIAKERETDPAASMVLRQPAVQTAYQNMQKAFADPTVPADAKQAAARDYATKTVMEQTRLGIPTDQQQILPKSYIGNIAHGINAAVTAEDPQARVALIGRIQGEAANWGDQWPAVVRQLTPTMQPIVRAIAAGADPVAMTRLLSLGPKEDPVKELKEQNDAKASDVSKALNDAMAPFKATLVGRQLDRDYPGYYGIAEKLAALYVGRDGKSAADAATAAFNAIIGNRYDFRDTYRVPKSAGVAADDVQAGAQAARGIIAAGGQSGAPSGDFAGMLAKGNVDLDKRPQVKNADGSVSTVRSMSFNEDGKEVLVPTVSDDGRILSDKDAIAQYRESGKFLGKFDTPKNADAYAQALHQAQADRYLGPLAVQPAVNDIGLTDARSDSFQKFARDGRWVTAPDNSGLNLAYGGKFVRGHDGKPLALTWQQLGKLGATPEARKRAVSSAVLNSGQTP